MEPALGRIDLDGFVTLWGLKRVVFIFVIVVLRVVAHSPRDDNLERALKNICLNKYFIACLVLILNVLSVPGGIRQCIHFF